LSAQFAHDFAHSSHPSTFLMDQIGWLLLEQLPWQGPVDTTARV